MMAARLLLQRGCLSSVTRNTRPLSTPYSLFSLPGTSPYSLSKNRPSLEVYSQRSCLTGEEEQDACGMHAKPPTPCPFQPSIIITFTLYQSICPSHLWLLSWASSVALLLQMASSDSADLPPTSRILERGCAKCS